MNEIQQLIQHYGDFIYLITFIWTALEGETFVIFAGLAAQKGMINPWFLFVAAWFGSFTGDQVLFLIGRRYGSRLLARMPKIKPAVDKSLHWLEKHADIFILTYRFMYGVRNVSSLAIGMSSLPHRKFAILNFIAACIWSASFVGSGYFFASMVSKISRRTEVLESGVHQVTMSVLALFVVILCLRFVINRYRDRRASK